MADVPGSSSSSSQHLFDDYEATNDTKGNGNVEGLRTYFHSPAVAL